MRRAVLSLVVCAVPLVAWASDRGAKAGIEAGNRRFEEGVAKGDAAAIAKLYATDAAILPPGGPMLEGRAEIEKAFAGMLGQGFKKIVLTSREVHAMGNLALEVGSWRLEDAAKKSGSTWQLYRDMWNDNAPPEPPKAEKTAPASK